VSAWDMRGYMSRDQAPNLCTRSLSQPSLKVSATLPPQVQFPDGSTTPCLAPFISLINHSPWPHAVHFSRIDNKNMLK
jgi:hypothetical protein